LARRSAYGVGDFCVSPEQAKKQGISANRWLENFAFDNLQQFGLIDKNIVSPQYFGANLQQKKTYTVTSKACLVAERLFLRNHFVNAVRERNKFSCESAGIDITN
jgi:hypothetical protein